MKFAINVNKFSGSSFVKFHDYFVSQGGETEEWGKHWKIVEAPDMQGARMIAIHQPHGRQDFGLFCGDCGLEKHGGPCPDPRCKCCGGSRKAFQVFCGAACSAKWEAGDRP